jgi:type IV pilus assembly protein PilO
MLAIAYYFLLFSPLRQEYLAKYDERTQKETRKAQLGQTVAELENVRRNAPDVERQILEISKRIPEQGEIPILIVQIEDVAEEADVTQLLIEPGSPEPPPGGGDFSRIPITMSFRGTYEEMQDFLLRLRNLVRLVTVNEVTYCRLPAPVSNADCPIEETGEGEETTAADRRVENMLTIKVEAEVYVQPAAGEITGRATTPTRETTAPREGTSRGGGSNK